MVATGMSFYSFRHAFAQRLVDQIGLERTRAAMSHQGGLTVLEDVYANTDKGEDYTALGLPGQTIRGAQEIREAYDHQPNIRHVTLLLYYPSSQYLIRCRRLSKKVTALPVKFTFDIARTCNPVFDRIHREVESFAPYIEGKCADELSANPDAWKRLVVSCRILSCPVRS